MTRSTPPSSIVSPDPIANELRLAQRELYGRDGVQYFPAPGLIAATQVALALRMPLLLTGEPGCGKTDFAYVMARVVAEQAAKERGEHVDGESVKLDDDANYGLLECNVRTDTRARDLLYSYDAMVRFGDSQTGHPADRDKARDPREYIALEPLGIAFMSQYWRVVLIDEIDKAPRDLPNDLLREIERGEFDIHELPRNPKKGTPVSKPRDPDPVTGASLSRRMRRDQDVRKPLVVITSNSNRQLPEAFLRRCSFYNMRFPERKALLKIVRARVGDAEPMLLETIVDVFDSARKLPKLSKRASTAELIDWASVLLHVFDLGDTKDKLRKFAGGSKDIGWSDLPAIGCLFKMQEDLDSADAHRAST